MARLDAAFFYRHAGYGYDPKKETQEQGRRRGAKALANALAKAHAEGYTFEWVEDAEGDRSGIEHDGSIYGCVMHSPSGKDVASLWAIDLGDRDPYSDPYARVVEAELATEVK
jgi:hypothetical protein